MRILYGVQGTGQGHISRARAMARSLSQWNVDVTWLFSGRPRERLFDMAPYGDFQHRPGLSFTTRAGRIDRLATLRDNKLTAFRRNVAELDLQGFDLVVTDFEPVTAWAARRAGIRSVGIGHQYAFGKDTPKAGQSWLASRILRHFAPTDTNLGLHWHPYSDHILPPILDLPDCHVQAGDYLLVYLPFENQDDVTALLQQQSDHRFVQYSAEIFDALHGNVRRCRANVTGFKQHLAGCAGVICNSGFELISECLHWDKPVLTKPLAGQMEQSSNALALSQLGYASTMQELDKEQLQQWLASPRHTPAIRFPDVADTLARWLATGACAPPALLAQRLWGSETSGAHKPVYGPMAAAAAIEVGGAPA